MWNLVMFDLPVKTKPQRRNATVFRNMLLDMGFWMVQYSVYVRYTPTGASAAPTIAKIKRNTPEGGEVRIVSITDRQWSTAWRFARMEEAPVEEAPEQLTIF